MIPGTRIEPILFGDGDRITLSDLETWSLPNTDLVVLSACRTAVSRVLGNGEEILGFGYQIQRTGARGAIASLWCVDDGGTQTLMSEFYPYLNSGLSEANALRLSQRALIQNLRLDHPYYRAPFIPTGNGL